MIVDTSALIAILTREPEAALFNAKIAEAVSPRISAGTLVEARLVAARYGTGDELEQLLLAAAIEVAPVDSAQADIAFQGFLRFGKGRHAAGLNFGDLFAYALARTTGEPLLFKGDDFARTDVVAAA